MARRYQICGEWRTREELSDGLAVQCAAITDTRTGTVYPSGAYRVVRDGRPAVRGKGGTVPFIGECAWSDADRLVADLMWSARSSVAW